MSVFDFILSPKEKVLLEDIVLEDSIRDAIIQLIKEHKHIEQLKKYNLPVNNKILLYGNSGCGKTMTAAAIANALDKNIYIINLSTIINSRIGETSLNIKQLFDKAAKEQAVLFLDEFDHIAKARGNDERDVGEMRRLVNTLIQLIDYFPEKALLICATNHAEIIDSAIIRRFQQRIHYTLPSEQILNQYYDKILSNLPNELKAINRVYNISFAEAKDLALTQVKRNLLNKLEENTSTSNAG
ncbi:MAG: ATP-binding protein [Bacteroidia bacterium]|nr:ATP-binding protein [Bacteroidia bacterium]MCZ2140777.1 ATP-binding protein [Bacteroidia bacterium]